METIRDEKTPRTAAIRQPVEVQHALHGTGRMLRRGLHGAKNWALEPEEDGTQRTPWSKLLRVLVVLAPLWILLSTVTGGPERGGKSVSIWQTLFMTLLITVVGLAFFSARERRLGREEPWTDLPQLGTESDSPEAKTRIASSSEEPTEVPASMQVSDSGLDGGPSGGVVTPGDIPGVSDQTPQVDPVAVTQVVPTALAEDGERRPFVQVNGGDQADGFASRAASEVDTGHGASATTRLIPDALDEETPTVPLGGGHPSWSSVTLSLETGPSMQVRTPGVVAGEPVREASSPVTVSDGEPEAPLSVWPVAGPATPAIQEELFPQVTTLGAVVTPPVLATPGPFPVTEAPVSDDWWLTKPDASVPEAEREAPADLPGEVPAAEPEPEPVQPEDPPQADNLLGYDPAVVMYLALKAMPEASEEQKEEARRNAAQWARRETEAGRQSQRSAGRILGVSKTTISNWLGHDPEHDPWADSEDE